MPRGDNARWHPPKHYEYFTHAPNQNPGNRWLAHRLDAHRHIPDYPLDSELWSDGVAPPRPGRECYPTAIAHGHGYGPYGTLETAISIRLSDITSAERNALSQLLHSA